jgi:hypothetical protein
LILQYLPISTTRRVEPFGGSAAGPRSAAVPGGGFGHRPGARFWNWRRDAAVTRRRGRLRYDLPMTVLQPFQYQGSERALAPLILQYLPISTTRRVEPFGGSAASPRSAAVPGGGFGHRPGACSKNSRRDAASTRRRGRLRYE